MCGIVGYVNYQNNISNDKNIITNMNSTLSKRGPDEEGIYLDNNVALGHKRLIVIDPKSGKQPFIENYSYGRYILIYNGQIYNTKELKETLLKNRI